MVRDTLRNLCCKSNSIIYKLFSVAMLLVLTFYFPAFVYADCQDRCVNQYERCSQRVTQKIGENFGSNLATTLVTKGRGQITNYDGGAAEQECQDQRDSCFDSCEQQDN